MWSPAEYNRHRGERHRPFHELVARVAVERPSVVVDLGCGDGALTATLAERWPDARVRGVDSSEDMIGAALASQESSLAAARDAGRLSFERGALEAFTSTEAVDVVVANASLQWVADHEALVPRLAALVAPGGALAFQVPQNFDAPSHTLLREVARAPRWAARLEAAAERPWPCLSTARYVEVLAGLGFAVDAWETEYFHVLPGEDAVLGWTSGTALRPVIAALDEADAAAFRAEYGARLREAYPRRAHGTVFPFRRQFVVAHRP
jgi:trans-aconitate 2-methyltransferase